MIDVRIFTSVLFDSWVPTTPFYIIICEEGHACESRTNSLLVDSFIDRESSKIALSVKEGKSLQATNKNS